MLGCGLGLLLVALYISLYSYWLNPRQPNGPPFKLSATAQRLELTRVIDSQLAAFQREDFAGAYGFATEGFKEQFSAEALEKMVRNGYPGMLRSRGASYGVVVDNGRDAVVIVVLTGLSGRLHHYEYFLVREPDGWRISGVLQVALPGNFM